MRESQEEAEDKGGILGPHSSNNEGGCYIMCGLPHTDAMSGSGYRRREGGREEGTGVYSSRILGFG